MVLNAKRYLMWFLVMVYGLFKGIFANLILWRHRALFGCVVPEQHQEKKGMKMCQIFYNAKLFLTSYTE